MAVDLNNCLLELSGTLGDGLPVDDLVKKLRDRLRPVDGRGAYPSPEDPGVNVGQIACLQWICLLLSHSPQQMLQKKTMKELFMPIFESLMHPNDEAKLDGHSLD